MNNQCINFKQRTKTKDKRKTVYFYCTKQKKEITFDDCKGCIYKEYKKHVKTLKKGVNLNKKYNKLSKTNQKPTKMNQRSSKLAKLERNRFSLFTDDLEHCYFCGKKKENIHEVIFGKNRINSIKFGLTLPLCLEHHLLMHKDTTLIKEYKQKGQALFNKTYPDLNFENIFRENYLK